jgi:PAS domain S-box-containing protein
MPQREVELILMRQLASTLAMPIVLVDPQGDILFFNEAAEEIVGLRFDEIGRMRFAEWTSLVQATDEDGVPLEPEDRFLPRAVHSQEPAHRRQWLTGRDGVTREIEGTAFPLRGQSGQVLATVGIFWEIGS